MRRGRVLKIEYTFIEKYYSKGGGHWPAHAPQKFGMGGGGQTQIKVPPWGKRLLVRRKKPPPTWKNSLSFSRGGGAILDLVYSGCVLFNNQN